MFLEKNGQIYMEDDSKKIVAYIKFETKEDTFYATSTFVDPALRGGKVAYNLVLALAQKARLENKKILPICSYVVELFKRDETFEDVWKK